jgi:hypothetical protein
MEATARLVAHMAAIFVVALVSITFWWLPHQILVGRQAVTSENAGVKDFLDSPLYLLRSELYTLSVVIIIDFRQHLPV